MNATALLIDLMNLGPLGLCDVIRSADGHYLGRHRGEVGYNVFVGEPKAAPGPGQDRSRQLWQSWSQEQRDAVSFRASAPAEGLPINLGEFGIVPEPLLQEPAPEKLNGETVQKLNALDTIHRLMFGIEWHDERLRKIGEAMSAAGYSFDTEPPAADQAAENRANGRTPAAWPALETLEAVHRELDGKEWSADTTDAIAEILAAAGYTFADPDDDEEAEPLDSEQREALRLRLQAEADQAEGGEG